MLAPAVSSAAPLKALILDGQNNHDWQASTPLLKRALENTGLFQVEIATSPAKGADMSNFRPKFADYAVVVSNYNGAAWPAETQAAFVDYMKNGGGFVVIHAASNAFPDWPEYNVICGLGAGKAATKNPGRGSTGTKRSSAIPHPVAAATMARSTNFKSSLENQIS